MLTEILLVFLILIVIFHVYTRHGYRGRLFNKMDGPKHYPLVGGMLQFINIENTHDLWEVARVLIAKYYPISRFWGFYDPLVNVYHPDDLEILLSNQRSIEKGYVYWYLQPWLKFGLLTSGDDKWHQRRKILTPAFHFGILKKYMDITSEQGEKFIDELKKEGDEVVKNLAPLCSNYTLNIICESTLGVALDKMDSKTVLEYKKAIHDMGQVVVYRMVRPYIFNWMLPFARRIYKVQNDALIVLHGFIDKVIKERREFHASTSGKFLNDYTENLEDTVYNDFNVVGQKKRLAMLDLLLTAEKNGQIDDEGIKEEVNTFTFEGHDTSSMAMTYTLMLLAENKEAQSRARAEVTGIIDKSNGRVGIAEVQDFNYLERCIKESLRLYPPVSTIMRCTSEEIQLKHARIPINTHVMVHFWNTHRDPKFWTNPDKFDPDRFLPENSKYRHPYAYLPFSAGPRNCIGQKFAMMELKSLIARVLYDFYLEPIDRLADMRICADIIIRPLDPVHMKFMKINK